MPSRLKIELLAIEHLDELADLLCQAEVYKYIEGSAPTTDEFKSHLTFAIRKSAFKNRLFLNYLVREGDSGAMLGRLEATIHDSLAEIAYLFAPKYWGKGYATEAMQWLHSEIVSAHSISGFWATTNPENVRSQALLIRSSYVEFKPPLPKLLSYSPGDMVFHRNR